MDITKCEDKECPKKETCFRWTAPSNELQSYFVETPRKGTKCEFYLNNKLNKKDENNKYN